MLANVERLSVVYTIIFVSLDLRTNKTEKNVLDDSLQSDNQTKNEHREHCYV